MAPRARWQTPEVHLGYEVPSGKYKTKKSEKRMLKKLKMIRTMLVNDINRELQDLDLKKSQCELIDEIISNGTSVICLFDRDDFRPMYGEICIHKDIGGLHVSEDFSFMFNNNYHDMCEYLLHAYLVMKKKTSNDEIIAPIVCNNIAIELAYDDLEKIFLINLGLFEPVSKFYGAVTKLKRWLKIKKHGLQLKRMKIRLLILDTDGFVCYDKVIGVLVGCAKNKIIISEVPDLMNRLHHVMKNNNPIKCRYLMVSSGCRGVNVRAAGIVGRSFANPILYGPVITHSKRENLIKAIAPDKIRMDLYDKLNIRQYRLDDFSEFIDKLDISRKNNAIYNSDELLSSFVDGVRNAHNHKDFASNGFVLDEISNITFDDPRKLIDNEVHLYNVRIFINYANERGDVDGVLKKRMIDYIDNIKSIDCAENSLNPKIRARMFFFKLLENVRDLLYISNLITDVSILSKMPIIGAKISAEWLIGTLKISGFDCYKRLHAISAPTARLYHKSPITCDMTIESNCEKKTRECNLAIEKGICRHIMELIDENDDSCCDDDSDDDNFITYY